MFTGIVEELGKVKEIRRGPRSAQLVLEAQKVLEDVKMGDSIAVNGVCLTVVEFAKDYFVADVMDETLRKTALARVQRGSYVNLERALRMGDRLGGHIVSGHVDEVGEIVGQKKIDIAVITAITCSSDLLKYLIPKGSIAIDGISLTVVDVTQQGFTVSLIPHTAGETTLGIKKKGDLVNLEADMLMKYVERLLSTQSEEGTKKTAKGNLTREFLLEQGY
ncbi:riboflavin synthase [Heliorestis acidaminivorans]|uniref:Riboflavin synthase n=1 Tax=Heliorestis acidaminivorans TaxID=553427 RepID=A0A6I0EVN3_9FIRM|nr:riboflavin synthase [Heliorestis acidaminivorans]KAB2954464.1 riboflavin synthase [Heliorestis acidaminivorans]